jgi:hypothetical protein
MEKISKEVNAVQASKTDPILQNRVLIWLALATGLLLLVPLVAMQSTDDVTWVLGDFVVAGTLLFGTGLLFVLAARKLRASRVVIGLALAAALIYVAAEIAVGVVTPLGS